MDPATITQIITALSIIAKIVDALGVGGIIALALAGPVIVVVAVLLLSQFNNQRLAKIVEIYRNDADKRFEVYRKDSGDRFEEYRHGMEKTLDEYDDSLRQVIQFYKDNVELVKNITSIAADLKDVVVLNATNMQRVTDKVDANQFCPIIKQGSKP